MSFCRLARVDASLPKNHWRRSLSMPTTLKPSRANRLTLSDPINPAAPVTITVLIGMYKLTASAGAGFRRKWILCVVNHSTLQRCDIRPFCAPGSEDGVREVGSPLRAHSLRPHAFPHASDITECPAIKGQSFLNRCQYFRVMLPTANRAIINRLRDVAVSRRKNEFFAGGFMVVRLVRMPG